VAAALTTPLLALLMLSVIEVRRAAEDAAHVRNETRLARAAVGPTGVISRLQDERTWATIDLVGMHDLYPVTAEGYDATRQATDAAIRDFRADTRAKGGDVEALYRKRSRHSMNWQQSARTSTDQHHLARWTPTCPSSRRSTTGTRH
jgi:hypothetical protein